MSVSGFRGRAALVGAAIVVLLLSGCGRKGMLEPPPTAGVAAPASATVDPSQRQATGAGSGLGEPEHSALDGERTAAAAPTTPARRTFFLDWLLD